MEKELGFGIIGCGFISNHHAQAILHTEGACLIGATDVNEQNAEAFCKKFGITHFHSAQEMMSSDKVDIVCICTPSGFHAQNALEVIRAGKHVLVEKPLALNVEDCELLISEAEKHGVKASVVSQCRFHKTSKTLKKLVEDGRLGRIVTADLTMKYYRSPEYYLASPWRGTWEHDGGGALMNQGIHGIDILLSVMGKVRSVHGLARTLARKIETEDTAAAIVEYENGALGLIQGTTSVYPGYPRNFVVSGTKGTVGIAENAFTEWNIEGEAIPADIEIGKAKNSGASTPHDLDFAEHVPHIEEMVRAIREDVPLTSSFEDGRNAVRLITSIYESSRTGKTIYFD